MRWQGWQSRPRHDTTSGTHISERRSTSRPRDGRELDRRGWPCSDRRWPPRGRHVHAEPPANLSHTRAGPNARWPRGTTAEALSGGEIGRSPGKTHRTRAATETHGGTLCCGRSVDGRPCGHRETEPSATPPHAYSWHPHQYSCPH